MPVHQADLRRFAEEVRRLSGEGEPPLYPAYWYLLNAAYPSSHKVDILRRAPGTWFPDVTVSRGLRLVTWIELKRPEVPIDPLPAADQIRFERYRTALPYVALTNGWLWILYESGQETARVELPREWLTGSQDLKPEEGAALSGFLGRLTLLAPAVATDYRDAVRLLATAARLLNQAVLELIDVGLPASMLQARRAMTELLRTNPEDPEEISPEHFADTVAQMVTFGYLLARVEADQDIDPHTGYGALSTAQHPFLKSTLHAVIAADVELEAAIGGLLRTVVDAVNAAAPKLAGTTGKWKQVPYIYEEFFAQYRPEHRFDYGVFYTDEEITRFQVRQIREALIARLGLRGLTDPTARFLEPACGTGTYLLALAEEALAEAKELGLPESAVLLELFRDRVVGFEVSPGPAAVAQARLVAWLRSHGVSLNQRFPVYTVNSLAPPAVGGTHAPSANLWADSIGTEQAAGDRVKRDEAVLVVFGNPPWGDRPREAFAVGGEGGNLITEWAHGTSAAVINLYDLYVAFWRFACDLLLDRPGVQPARGVVSYITNRSWIYGRAFEGMRHWLRDRNVSADLVDLGGDIRAGARRDDEPVFAIQAGSAIGTLIFGSADADLRYHRLLGTRKEKLDQLARDDLADPQPVEGGRGSRFGPVDWGPIIDAPSIKEILSARYPGVKTHRDELVVDPDRDNLLHRLTAWAASPDHERSERFRETRDRQAPTGPYEVGPGHVVRHRYRPLDDSWLYADQRFVDQPGRISRIYQAKNDLECLLCLDTRTTEGPVVIAAAALPGYNSFRGSYETHVFLIQPTNSGFMLNGSEELHLGEQDLLTSAARPWAERHAATARDVGAYLLALGNAPAYGEAFSDAIAVETIRFPLTDDTGLFSEAVAVGKRLLDAWALRVEPAGGWHQITSGGPLGDFTIEAGAVTFANGDRLTRLHPRIDEFSVSRWPVFRRFLEARSHLTLSVELGTHVQQVAGAIGVILETQASSDSLLERVIAGPQARL